MIFQPKRRQFLQTSTSLAVMTALPATANTASDFPRGPVKIIVPLTAGGAGDVATRALALELENIWHKPVIIENKPGGLFQIGMNALAALPADGHTLLHLHNSLASVQAVQKAFDMKKALAPISLTMDAPMVLLVSGKSPYKSLDDLLKAARESPGKISYSSLGVGSVEHLKSEQLARTGNFKALNVPYRAGTDMVNGLIGGEVDFTLTASIFAQMYGPSGRVRVLAVIKDKRWDAMREVPTISEAGLPVAALNFWGGLAAKAGTSPAVLDRLFKDICTASMRPSVAARMSNNGSVPVVSESPRQFADFIQSEVSWMSKLAGELSLGG